MKSLIPSMLVLSTLLAGCQSHPPRQLPAGPGPEDLVLARRSGRTVILTGSGDRRFIKFPPSEMVGRVQCFDPAADKKEFETLYARSQKAADGKPGFLPLGLSVVASSRAPGAEGRQLIYVVNNARRGAGGVEVFEFVGDTLQPLGSVGAPSPLLLHANGIAAARDGTVYVSIFGAWPGKKPFSLAPAQPLEPQIHTIVRFTPGASYRQGKWEIVAEGINGPNGLALTPAEDQLLVSAYHGKNVFALRRDRKGAFTGKPIPVLNRLAFSPDNISRTRDGYVVAGQKSFVATGLHFLCREYPCRSGATRFTWNGKCVREEDWTDKIHGDAGCPSVVLPLGDRLYVGHIQRRNVGVLLK